MITLKIYKKENKSELEKEYKVDGYDLMLGTVEDFMAIIDIDKLNDGMELTKMVVKGYGKLKPLLMDVFPEVTDDELNRTKVSELIKTVMEIGMAIGDSLKELKTGNLRRA